MSVPDDAVQFGSLPVLSTSHSYCQNYGLALKICCFQYHYFIYSLARGSITCLFYTQIKLKNREHFVNLLTTFYLFSSDYNLNSFTFVTKLGVKRKNKRWEQDTYKLGRRGSQGRLYRPIEEGEQVGRRELSDHAGSFRRHVQATRAHHTVNGLEWLAADR